MKTAYSSSLCWRRAVVTDAPAIAQMAFDVMETNPITMEYLPQSGNNLAPDNWSAHRRNTREIGGSVGQYAQFLEQETASWRHELEIMNANKNVICVAFNLCEPDTLLGCVGFSEGENFDVAIDKIFARREAHKIGTFLLDTVKKRAKHEGMLTLSANASKGVCPFFTENGFKMVNGYLSTHDNPMVCDLTDDTHASLGRGKRSIHIFPRQS